MQTKPVELLAVRGLETTTPGFRGELVRLADRLGLNPSYIAAVIALESGFNPRAKNPTGGAVGLIQFMPQTARHLGTSSEELLGMNATEQLAFVEKFFRGVPPSRIRKDVPGDYYMATFLPAFVGRPKEYVLARRGEKIYDQNRALDRSGEGILTVGDVHAVIEAEVQRAEARPRIIADPLPQPTTGPASGSSSAAPSHGSPTDSSEAAAAMPVPAPSAPEPDGAQSSGNAPAPSAAERDLLEAVRAAEGEFGVEPGAGLRLLANAVRVATDMRMLDLYWREHVWPRVAQNERLRTEFRALLIQVLAGAGLQVVGKPSRRTKRKEPEPEATEAEPS